MEHSEYEIMSYEDTADGTICAILKIVDGEPKCIYHIPSFGFTIPSPEVHRKEQEDE
jgi:hypothetical protein